MSDSSLSRLFPSDRIKAQIQKRIQTRAPESISRQDAPHRTTHGSHAWSLPSRYESLRQPQDGAVLTSDEDTESTALSTNAKKIRESADAHLSGTMRSLARRVMGLNVTAYRSHPAFKQPEPYFAEPHLPKLLKTMRKGPDGTRSTDANLASQPQVA